VELITNIIVEYLKHNRRLCVPKLGTFIVKQSSGEIIFSELMRNDDGVLRSLLMAYGTKELEANGMIDRFVFEIRHAITTEGKYSIEALGTFTAEVNNTIAFAQVRQQQVFGGNIKPPLDILDKRKVQRPTTRAPYQHVAMQTATARPTKRHSAESTQEGLTMGKPDAYLRGLKYDSNKNKKREDSSRSSKRPGGNKWGVMALFIIAILATAAIMVWLQKRNVQPTAPTAPVVIEPQPIERDTVTITEPTIDSLAVEATAIEELTETQATTYNE
jgi:hypothetical protein